MSLYPQSQAYSQVPFPVSGYPPTMPPPGAYHYPPPLPQPVYLVDPNMFRRDYMTRLGELTVNSRPVIQNLSMIAQEYTRFAEIVAQCIESHIRRVPPWMKLPAFYLLDAISKNVFDPYARFFTPLVVRLYLDTYDQVDQSTRSKMEEMLLTWRTGAPNGRELFGIVPQVAIERHIWGGDSTQTAMSSSGSQISTSQVLSELEFTLNQKERALQSNPYDKISQNHVAVLHQLRKLVQAGVSQDELSQILHQLRTLAPAPQPAPAPPPPPPAPIQQTYTQQSYANTTLNNFPAPPVQSSYPPQPSYPSYVQTKSEPLNLSGFLSSQSASMPPMASSSSAPAVSLSAPAGSIANLFNALLKAGVVSASGTPIGAGATAKTEESSQHVDPAREAARQYRKSILSQKIKLSSADITKHHPQIVELLYGRQPAQCKQCGIRFPDGPVGRKKMEEHLDMHFRQNRKASQAVGRGYSRSWFVSVEDWIYDGSVDSKGKGRADGSRPLNAKAAAAAEAAKREAELRALHVVVPPGDEAKSISCPICKEPMKSEFLEDEEEWVWQNAVLKDSKIYHATCHAEAMASKSNLVVRLRNEASSRSRSRTPEKRTPPPLNGEVKKVETLSPSKIIGSKRKADDDNASLTTEERANLPPMKKLAVSASA